MKRLTTNLSIGPLCLLCAVMLIQGCASLPEQALSPADEGRAIPLALGSEMLVRIEAQVSTGYRWEAHPARGLVAVKEHAIESAGGGIVGGIDIQVMKVTALAAGEDEVEFAYARPFGPPEKPAKRFVVKFVVK